jgi:hypothetical protein
MTLAFVSLAIGLAATAYTLHRSTVGASVSTGSFLLLLAGLAVGAVALVPVAAPEDAAWRGPVHAGSALIFFMSAASGAALASPHLSSAVALTARLLVLAVLVFLVSMAKAPGLFPIRGWLQRACFVLVAVWLLLVGAHLLATSQPA